MARQLFFGNEAREKMKKGIDLVADAVRITIGPKGRNVAIDKGYGAPTVTNDGVTIAKDIQLSDKIANMGAEIIKEVADKTNENAGDGTTTAVVLAHELVSQGFKRTVMGVNPMGVRLGIEAATAEVVTALQAMAKPIKNDAEIVQVATISAESEEYGKIITDAIKKVGKDGVVTVEESQTFGVESDVVQGMQFDKGYVSAYMITNPERMEAEFSDPYILITDKKISSIKEILPILEKIAATGKKEVVIIADDVDGDALTTLVINKMRGTFNALAIKAPGYGDRKEEMLEDIAVMTGGKVISEKTGLKLEMAELNLLGRAGKVVATKDDTTIVNGKGKKQAIEDRVAQVRAQIETTESKYDKEKLESRLGKLSGGVAVIRVGGATETEVKYKKLKIEDAVEATRAAIEEGIVPGGGTALVRAGDKVASKKIVPTSKEIAHEFQVGVEILLKSLEAPLRQIAVNAGKDDGAVIVDTIKKGEDNQGYDANADKIVNDMVKAGIVDPVKVTRTALQNAASAAAMLLTMEVAITDEPKKEEHAPHSAAPGMDY